MTDYQQVAYYVSFFEHFSPIAYWDINAWRIGYGSDTKGSTQTPVKRGDTETYQDALANLALRIPEYEITVTRQVTQSSWDQMPENTKTALLDFAYNYGSLTPTLASHVTAVDLHNVCLELQNRETDNGGENRSRRYSEATLVATCFQTIK